MKYLKHLKPYYFELVPFAYLVFIFFGTGLIEGGPNLKKYDMQK